MNGGGCVVLTAREIRVNSVWPWNGPSCQTQHPRLRQSVLADLGQCTLRLSIHMCFLSWHTPATTGTSQTREGA